VLCACAPAFRRCEVSELFTTAKLACRTGEQAKSETPRKSFDSCGTCSTRLSYRSPVTQSVLDLAGFEPATPSL
jgi:hypothetical protein